MTAAATKTVAMKRYDLVVAFISLNTKTMQITKKTLDSPIFILRKCSLFHKSRRHLTLYEKYSSLLDAFLLVYSSFEINLQATFTRCKKYSSLLDMFLLVYSYLCCTKQYSIELYDRKKSKSALRTQSYRTLAYRRCAHCLVQLLVCPPAWRRLHLPYRGHRFKPFRSRR